MKKAQLRLHHCELISSYIKYGMLLVLCAGILLYQVTTITINSISLNRAMWVLGITAIEFSALIALVGFSLYKKSISYILWYEGILDCLSIPIIITDKNGALCFINKAVRRLILMNQDAELNGLNSRHLIDANGNVKKTSWFHNGEEYRTEGSRFMVDGQSAGYIISLFNKREMGELLDAGGTRDEMITKINTLLKRLSTATNHFNDYAHTIAGNSSRQADIIDSLSEVIAGIASGVIEEQNDLSEKMRTVKVKMHHYVESSGAQTELMIQTAQELQSARDSVGNVLHDIGQN